MLKISLSLAASAKQWVRRARLPFAALLAVSCAAAPAFSQSLPEQQLQQTSIFSPYSWNFNIGGGVRFAPAYAGSDHYKIRPLTIGSLSYRNAVFAGPAGLGADFLKFVRIEGLRAGPILGYRGGRKQTNDSRLNGLGNIGASVEAGVYFDYDLGPFTFSGTYRRAVTNSNNGGIARLQLDYKQMLLHNKMEVHVGPVMDFGDGRYVKKWFGVTPSQSITSGLPVYRPSGGPTGAGIYFTADYYLNPSLFIRGFGTLRRVIGVDGSPIVVEPNQALAGLGLVYHWQGGE